MCVWVCVSVINATFFNYCINMDFESVNKDLYNTKSTLISYFHIKIKNWNVSSRKFTSRFYKNKNKSVFSRKLMSCYHFIP